MQINYSQLPGSGPIIRACDVCASLYRVTQSRLDKGQGRLCSNRCRGALIPRKSAEHLAFSCGTCSAAVRRRPSELSKSGLYFCGTTCRLAWFAARGGTPAKERLQNGSAVQEDGCVIWQGKPGSHGYGTIAVNGARTLTHRYAWMLATGETLSADDTICHTCDNRLCIKTDGVGTYEVNGKAFPRRGHLFKASLAVNNADMAAKGRHGKTSLRGVQIKGAKLTDETVRAIRAEHAAGAKGTDLAKRYKVSTAVISEVVTRRTWKHVT